MATTTTAITEHSHSVHPDDILYSILSFCDTDTLVTIHSQPWPLATIAEFYLKHRSIRIDSYQLPTVADLTDRLAHLQPIVRRLLVSGTHRHRYFTAAHFDMTHSMLDYIGRCPNLTQLTIDQMRCHCNALRCNCAIRPDLRRIRTLRIDRYLNDHLVDACLRSCADNGALLELHLQCVRHLRAAPAGIRTLNLTEHALPASGGVPTNWRWLYAYLRRWHGLRHLVVKQSVFGIAFALAPVVADAPRLRSLDVQVEDKRMEENVTGHAQLVRLRELRCLRLRVHSNALTQLLANWEPDHPLEVLRLEVRAFWFDDTHKAYFRKLRNVRTLELRFGDEVYGLVKLVEALAEMHSLRRLCVGAIADEGRVDAQLCERVVEKMEGMLPNCAGKIGVELTDDQMFDVMYCADQSKLMDHFLRRLVAGQR